jgi:zinc finger HIT domain-containing protein 1
MRKTRNMIADKTRGPKGFREFLEEAGLERAPPGEPTYLTAAVGPPRTRAARKYCSVCGDGSNYTCTRCGARYCCIRCYGVHTDTRCLKFIA